MNCAKIYNCTVWYNKFTYQTGTIIELNKIMLAAEIMHATPKKLVGKK